MLDTLSEFKFAGVCFTGLEYHHVGNPRQPDTPYCAVVFATWMPRTFNSMLQGTLITVRVVSQQHTAVAWNFILFNFAPVASSLTSYPLLNCRYFFWCRHEENDVVRIRDYHRLPLSPVDSDSPRLFFETIYQGIDTEREKRHAEQAPCRTEH